jgi:hypothetical protein
VGCINESKTSETRERKHSPDASWSVAHSEEPLLDEDERARPRAIKRA